MSTKSSVANAVGGKTARACDSCVRKRARWYCAADDAFLCQSCDSAVHSANPLARRHQRLRLNSSPPNSPSWLSGFTRKPRTRRPRPPKSDSDDLLVSLVPDEDNTNNNTNNNEEESEDLLLYRVPTFVVDPFVVDESASSLFLPSDLDLADFSADVESLLGRNLESECFDMEGIGLGRVKLEEQQQHQHQHRDTHDNYNCRSVPVQEFEAEVDLMRDVPSFQFDFDHDHDQKLAVVGVKNERQQHHQDQEYYCGGVDEDEEKKRKVALRLDCDAVIAAWGNDKSPWTTGERPDFQPDEAWPHCMAICGSVSYGQTCGEYGVSTATTAVGDSGREARVSRYREKRRTRLFSKKIRYEVRKLNAEKRPRMKGRFVKRITTPCTLPIITIN